MLDIKLVTTSSGDWQGLYIDDELVYDNHKITAEDALDFLQDRLPMAVDSSIEVDDDDLEKFKYELPSDFTMFRGILDED